MEEEIDVELETSSEAGKETDSEVELSKTLDESSNITKAATSDTISKPLKYLKLPFSKIKQIMKMDPDVMVVQHDAVFLVAKATELFIEYITKETNKQLSGQKRRTVMKRDVDATIENISQLCFLDGALE